MLTLKLRSLITELQQVLQFLSRHLAVLTDSCGVPDIPNAVRQVCEDIQYISTACVFIGVALDQRQNLAMSPTDNLRNMLKRLFPVVSIKRLLQRQNILQVLLQLFLLRVQIAYQLPMGRKRAGFGLSKDT
jgi:hypothetical protein